MTREWKPGDVAVCTLDDITVYAVHSNPANGRHWVTPEGERVRIDEGDLSPLVVIDPENAAEVERFARAYVAAAKSAPWNARRAKVIRELQIALREFAEPKPPKPDEPKGKGALAVDLRGRVWVRSDKGWTNLDADGDFLNWTTWELIDAVEVIREGL